MASEQSDEFFISQFVMNQNRIYRFVSSLVPQRTDAEDIFQQTCLTLWRNRAEFNPAAGNFTSWACAIAHNHVRNFRRKQTSQPVLLSDEIMESLVSTRNANQSLLDDLHHALEGCVEKLTPQQRELVERWYAGSQSIKDIAESGGRTPNAVYKILRHIRAALHECVQRAQAQGGTA